MALVTVVTTNIKYNYGRTLRMGEEVWDNFDDALEHYRARYNDLRLLIAYTPFNGKRAVDLHRHVENGIEFFKFAEKEINTKE